MPLKVTMELDKDDFISQPIYDEKALETYCQTRGITKESLSEEEKEPFIICYMSL